MFRSLIAFPLLAFVVVLQSAVVSRVSLLSGYADLMLVVLAAWALQAEVTIAWQWAVLGSVLVAFSSGLPWPVIFIGYFFVVFLAQMLKRRVWQAPLLALFSVTFLGTMFMNVFTLVVLQIMGSPTPVGQALGLVVLPSLLLNLLFSVPVHAVMRDLARWVSPSQEIE